MRIAIIAHLKYPIREPFAGGLEMHTFLLASKLKERGNDVTVFAASGSNVEGCRAVCLPTAAAASSEALYEVCDAKEHRAYLRIMDMLRAESFDVVHNNSLHYLPLTMGRLLDAPILTTLHTPPFDPFDEAVRNAAGEHHRFVAVSDAVSKQWRDHLTVRDMIPNGVNLSAFSFHANPSGPAYAVWYGRIVPEKGLHFAIDAARLAGLQLRFAGPMMDRDYFAAFIAPRLEADIVYEGHLKHADLAKLIGNASVFLCTPCWEEPYGLVVAEALASAVPVAAFARGAIPKILDATSGALAIPDDAASLAQAALKALRLSRADCRSRAEKVCDAELMIDRYIDLYMQMAGQLPVLDLHSLPLGPPACTT